MTEVRIRHFDDAESVHLADMPFDQLDTVIPTLESWGIAEHDHESLTGQFWYEPEANKAYFEVVIGWEDE